MNPPKSSHSPSNLATYKSQYLTSSEKEVLVRASEHYQPLFYRVKRRAK